jgi:hypothetical protein
MANRLYYLLLAAATLLLLFGLAHQSDQIQSHLQNLGMKGSNGHKPRYVFVDLGANAADSLEAFLRHEHAKFQYEYPRPEWATYEQAGE